MFSVQIDTARSWRGGQNQVLLTARGLHTRGHRVLVVAHPEGELRKRLDSGIEVLPLALRNEIDFFAAWQLARKIRELQPDIVHAHDPHGVAMAAIALAIGSGAHRPFLVAARRVDFPLKPNLFSRWKYRQVDQFVAASDAIRTILLRNGVPPERVATVHEGIDIGQVTRTAAIDARKEFSFPSDSTIVGNIAALVPHKGQKYFVEAAALVAKEMPNARFVILGEGELRSSLESQIRQFKLERTILLGGFRPDVLALLKGFDLLVMSSVTEGLGTSLLDAMAAEIPIVATTAGGIPEVVQDGETGLLVPPQNGRALAEAILTLLKDADRRRQLATAGLARVQQKFSVDRMVDDTLAEYEKLVAKAPSREENPPGSL